MVRAPAARAAVAVTVSLSASPMLRQAEGEKPPDAGAGFETGAFESLESDFQEVRLLPLGGACFAFALLRRRVLRRCCKSSWAIRAWSASAANMRSCTGH